VVDCIGQQPPSTTVSEGNATEASTAVLANTTNTRQSLKSFPGLAMS
jgi:hypothetical protein